MRWLKVIFGLFVDDGAFALAILIWLGAVWLVMPHFKVLTAPGGIIFFVVWH